MQDKKELEDFYQTPDPWGYMECTDDVYRKKLILQACNGKWKTALDVGAGEGWITKDLPADKIYGYELSDNAAKRFPENVERVFEPTPAELVIATGVLYKQYDRQALTDFILKSATKRIVTCNIKSWEINDIPEEWQVSVVEFEYRVYTEVLRIYDVPPAQHKKRKTK